ncbi:MAG: AAA family ATPase [Methylocystaceae bacterium]|nr:AAA family ATPase [Methylocystaceae bacterium]
MKIRHVLIKNYRGIRDFQWYPSEGTNCLIGPGDSCKSTILDAIDLALGARNAASFSDSDFHLYNTADPILIEITIGDLNDDLLNMETYGYFHRGFVSQTGEFVDEPGLNDETVLTVRLIVNEDLDPQWGLYSDRAYAEGRERNLIWKHRQLLAPVRLGTETKHHMAWGSRSILNKLSPNKATAANALAKAARQAREAFASEGCEGVDDVIEISKNVANSLGIPVTELYAMLDMKGASFSGGAIALHDEKHIPLRGLGTGSSRLFVSGLQKHIGVSPITLIDEVEFGLEPYRIVRLLDALGAKDADNNQQSFMTSHSPFVLKELKASQLNIVRCNLLNRPQELDEDGNLLPIEQEVINSIASLGNSEEKQKLLRTNAEAFLSPNVIVCEGKTEIGLIKGMDAYFSSNGNRSLVSHGAFWADGGGDPNLFARAAIFTSLGYRTYIFMDSDKVTEAENLQKMQAGNVPIIRWHNNNSTESVIVRHVPAGLIPQLLEIAEDWKSTETINNHIMQATDNALTLDVCKNNFDESMREILVQCAGERSWFKDITPAERVGSEIVAPRWQDFGNDFSEVISKLWDWVIISPTAQPNPVQGEQ